MEISICRDAAELGIKAAEKVRQLLTEAVKNQGCARMLVSTGASQFEYFRELVQYNDIEWNRIEVFHLDEYIGLDKTQKASFVKYLEERFINLVQPKAFYPVQGRGDIEENLRELTRLWAERPIDVGVIGIGENGHIAFNDPPADFETKEIYRIVTLDEACRRQQWREGWFPTIEDVPEQAVSMSVHGILQCKTIVSVVPHAVKAAAVKRTLQSAEITPEVPASILRTHADWHLFLDENSASGL